MEHGIVRTEEVVGFSVWLEKERREESQMSMPRSDAQVPTQPSGHPPNEQAVCLCKGPSLPAAAAAGRHLLVKLASRIGDAPVFVLVLMVW
jgi:hypothetical protein